MLFSLAVFMTLFHNYIKNVTMYHIFDMFITDQFEFKIFTGVNLQKRP